MSRSVLVIGKGKPHHITEAQATEWVAWGKAIWQKARQRVKYIGGKHSRPQMRDLSSFVDESVVIALRDRKSEDHYLAERFVKETRRTRERSAA